MLLEIFADLNNAQLFAVLAVQYGICYAVAALFALIASIYLLYA